jgi:hypothetical protein
MLADNDDFVFIGYTIVMPGGPLQTPIIVNKNISLTECGMNFTNREEAQENAWGDWAHIFLDYILNFNTSIFSNKLSSATQSIILLNKVYQLPNVRGINLYEFAYVPWVYQVGRRVVRFLIDDNRPILFNYGDSLYEPPQHPNEPPQQWYERNREIITDLEQKYPGLFEPIFYNPAQGIPVGPAVQPAPVRLPDNIGGKSRRKRSKTIRRRRNR